MTSHHAKAVFDAAITVSPEPPMPLQRELPPAEPFPVDALGTLLGEATTAIQVKTQAPRAICAQSVLGAAVLAVQGHADVRLPMGQTRPVSCYFITIGASGERKSTADNEALRPIRRHEEALRRYLNGRDAWAKQRDQVLNNKKHYPDVETKEAGLKLLGPAPVAPLNPMLICTEPTFEGIERLLPLGQPSLGVFSAEGGQFVGGHGMREETKLRTATSLSSMWDGQPIRRVRASDGAIVLPGRRLALHLMVQPDVATILLSDRLLADQGLLSRLLVTAPPTAAGTRFWRETAVSDPAIDAFDMRLFGILRAPLPLAQGTLNELNPPALEFSSQARSRWIRFSDEVESEVGPGGRLEPIRGLASKLAEHAARLAGILSLVRDVAGREISCESLEAGIELARHYAQEALRLEGASAIRPEIIRAKQLLTWLHEHWGEPLVSLPDVYQWGPSPLRDKKSALEAITILEGHLWLLRHEGAAVVKNVRRRDVWHIIRRPI
ncbi:YfjI family protein [Microvirga sp. P5_D2]